MTNDNANNPIQVFRDWLYDHLAGNDSKLDFHKSGEAYIRAFPSGEDPEKTYTYATIEVATDGYYRNASVEAVKLEMHGTYQGRHSARKNWTRYAKDKIEASPDVYLGKMVAWINERLEQAKTRDDSVKAQNEAKRINDEYRLAELTVENLGEPSKTLAASSLSEPSKWYLMPRYMNYQDGKYIIAPVGEGVYTVKVESCLNLKQLRKLNELLKEFESASKDAEDAQASIEGEVT